MALRIRGKAVVAETVRFGVEFEDGFVLECEDEVDARIMAAMTGGQLRTCDVYLTAWTEVEGES